MLKWDLTITMYNNERSQVYIGPVFISCRFLLAIAITVETCFMRNI